MLERGDYFRAVATFDPDLPAMFDDIDEWLDNENCDCEGVCKCPDG